MSDEELGGLRQELEEADLRVAAVNPGGFNFTTGNKQESHLKMIRAVDIANILGASIINTTLPGPRSFENAPDLPEGWEIGGRISIGGSQLATQDELQKTADCVRDIADVALKSDVTIALELHQNCYVDSSSSALAMLDLIGRDNVRLNPDMGNVQWIYATPQEHFEDAIGILAPVSVYVHVKNVRRVYLPDLDRASFIRTTIGEGDVDWRFCIEALADSGYSGWLTCEGDIGDGWDFRHAMANNLAYINSILTDIA
jgi:sugar phosphate isomerase/epimerase